MSTLFKSLSIDVTPNSAPTWSGTVDFSTVDLDTRLITATVPVTQISNFEYLYIQIPLWVEELEIKDEFLVNYKGVPLSVRSISKHHIPSVITPSISIITDDTSADYSEFNVIIAETFGNAINALFRGTTWGVKINVKHLAKYPVVSEGTPATVLNGSLIEQLNSLLALFSPNDLWGQSLCFYVNFFTSTIIISAPEGSGEVMSFSAADAHLYDFSVRKVKLDLPSEIWIEESESAIFRSASHTEDYGLKVESYNTTTNATVDLEEIGEQDDSQEEISATLTGERTTLGGLVLTDLCTSSMTETKSFSVTTKWGGALGGDTRTYSFTNSKTSEVESVIEYTYISGPPYQSSSLPFFKSSPVNNMFRLSMPGTRQQLARDFGPTKINIDHHPDYLLTTDGLQISSKKTTTIESSIIDSHFDINETKFFYPFYDGVEESVVTTIYQSFSYNDDGNLTGERTKKTVVKGNDITVSESFRTISPVNSQLSSEMTFTVVSNYAGEVSVDTLISTSVTDISVNIVSAEMSGPSSISVASSSEGTSALREKLIRTNTAFSDDIDVYGSIHVTTEYLTLEELEEFLEDNFILDPEYAFYVSFSSRHIDPRGALGGILTIGGMTQNTDKSIYLESGARITPVSSGLSYAMAKRSFRVTGVSMSWNSDNPPEISIALCQLV